MTAPTRAPFRIGLHPNAPKEYLSLPVPIQVRFEKAFDRVATDPFEARAGLDVKRIASLPRGLTLYRLRVGDHRACYLVVQPDRKVEVLVFAQRGEGYTRILARALSRT